ncbi:MAG: sugar ABC transporter permease [Anaerolineae bacterium]|nr:sugar ABC transporter permease [Anaerolineae bacterium]
MLPLEFCMFNPDPEAVYQIDALDQLLGVMLIGVGLVVVLWPLAWAAGLWAQHRNPIQTVEVSQQGLFKSRVMPIFLLAPTITILALFLYYPSIETFRLSTLLARLGARRTAFVCLDNFTSLIVDPDYIRTIGITIGLGLAIVIIGLVLALLVATMAYQPLFGARIYRTLLIWPYAISPVVAGIIFLLMFNPAGGIINYFLEGTIGMGVGWLNDPYAAPWAVIIASVWKSMGFNVLFYIAGLQNVPKDLQESAAIDGANVFQRFRHVVFPLLSPITFFLVITNLTYAFFETFGTIDYLTSGGPLKSTTTLMYRIYEVGIVNNDLGKGAAQSIVLFVMVIGLTIFQFRTQGSRVNYGA